MLTSIFRSLTTHLERLEHVRIGLEDAVDAVAHVEAVGPVVVGHLAVVLLDGDEEADARLVVEPLGAEEVDEHEERLPHLHHVLHLQSVVRESAKAPYMLASEFV